MNYKELAKEVFQIEADAISAMIEKLDDNFNLAVEAILHCQGRVIVAGIGKSGLIGKKITATLNSTGIASFFLHPTEALHGDLGLMRHDDLLMLISKSGRMGEMEILISAARRLEVKIIVLCGTVNSELFQSADIPLDCSVSREACPNNLVPTSSSTAALVMGDALAVALLKARNFSSTDFAKLHPGGFIGLRLLKKVKDLHHTGEEVPVVTHNASMKEMIFQMTGKRLGCVIMKNDTGKVEGIFTDGDLRRVAEKNSNFYELKALDVMVKNPKTIFVDEVLDAALAIMEKFSITQLPTVDIKGNLVGILHLHDILRSKLV
ncbi:MAG: KpsF/GutQ family sugar-phosphate isomerase [FCB group bacterium]|nr:KpsF/GutQ family sugar-phosphate isomerase [FCB group bacterium]